MKTTGALVSMLAITAALAGCASQVSLKEPATPRATAAPAATPVAAAPASNVRLAKSRNGKYDGELIGTAAPGSKFAKLQIGMEFNEVTQLIGGATSMHTHETGKRWIPFYFGNDVRRMQLNYTNEGCLSFTAGNVWGGGGNELVRITADPSGAQCRG